MALSMKSALDKDHRTTTVMQHRHFATIAQIIAALPDDIGPVVAAHFADKLKLTNPAFDRTRFVVACIPYRPNAMAEE
jgi:hypothetical protein